jgi:hypothetical protein
LNPSFLIYVAVGVLLLAALGWLSASAVRRRPKHDVHLALPAELDYSHVEYLPQIRQALSDLDIEYLRSAGAPGLAKTVRKERRQVALSFLAALRDDFEKLLGLARVIAAMSPEITVAQELQGLRLKAVFACRYQLIRWQLKCGFTPFDALRRLSDVFSGLTVRMEQAVEELSERAAFPEFTSPLDDRGLGAN